MNKELNDAIKDLRRVKKELPSFYNHALRYWLRHMWLGGKIEVYEWNLKRNAKTD